jgi:hypothetical protein
MNQAGQRGPDQEKNVLSWTALGPAQFMYA